MITVYDLTTMVLDQPRVLLFPAPMSSGRSGRRQKTRPLSRAHQPLLASLPSAATLPRALAWAPA